MRYSRFNGNFIIFHAHIKIKGILKSQILSKSKETPQRNESTSHLK